MADKREKVKCVICKRQIAKGVVWEGATICDTCTGGVKNMTRRLSRELTDREKRVDDATSTEEAVTEDHTEVDPDFQCT